MLIHVNAFKDLPSKQEMFELGLSNLISSEELMETQANDKTGESIRRFKQGMSKALFTTKCSRGLDFPGEMCNSVLFTKYPNPNISDTFWKIFKNTHPEHFWKFYTDKARREFLQRIYRAVRSVNDHIYVLSPDLRVIDTVRKMQRGEL
jgi:Rad3-related DNA helicase